MAQARSSMRGFGYQAERAGGYSFEVRPSPVGITIVERFAETGEAGAGATRAGQRERATLSAVRWNLVQST
ncbi:MAG: hypothetical protein KC442_20255, partial [Thermomicrobiales bacterium]|nr:hypothetical protein [Thermomicrobiales bacterium]